MPLNIKLSDEELKKLSPKELKEYMTMRRRLEGKKTTTKKEMAEKRKGRYRTGKGLTKSKRPKQFDKHRDPGAVERMMEFEKSLREAGFNKGGMANCGASVKPTQKSTKMMYGGMASKKK